MTYVFLFFSVDYFTLTSSLRFYCLLETIRSYDLAEENHFRVYALKQKFIWNFIEIKHYREHVKKDIKQNTRN